MKLSEIVASLNSLKETVAGFISDKTKATADSLATFSANLTKLETGAVAGLSAAQTELAAANSNLSTANTQLAASKSETSAIVSQLKASCAALSLTVRPDATAAEMITAMQGAVTSTLGRLQVDAAKVPAGVPTTAAGTSAKKMSLDEEIKARQAATPMK